MAAVRTLVISDLHLGDRAGHDVLRLPEPRERLLDAAGDVERVVLLGDTVELTSRHASRAMAAAEPVLRALGRRLGPDREVVLVPGNHDAPLVRRWARAQGRALPAAADVPGHASPALEHLLEWLGPARARTSYPGAWLEDGIWVHHGHYLDRHLIPESTFGLPRRLPGRPRRRSALPYDYERRRRSARSRQTLPERLAERPVGALLEGLAGLLHRVTVPVVPQLLRLGGLAPVTASLLDVQMRYAALPAMAQVVRHLGLDADWVLFGHVHRRGPIADEHWPAMGPTRLINTGSWQYEPLLLDRAQPPHGYWPGGAVVLGDGREPRSVGLLDDLDGARLRTAAPPP